MSFRASLLRFVLGAAAGALVMGVWCSRAAILPCQGACNPRGCEKPPCCSGDVNGDGMIDIADAVCLLSHLFGNKSACTLVQYTPPPCNPCNPCDACPPPPACPRGPWPIEGTFLSMPGISEEGVPALLDEFASLGMRLAIIQDTRDEVAAQPGAFTWARGCPDAIGTILREGAARDIDLYVGLVDSVDGFRLEPRATAVVADIDAAVAELVRRFGDMPALAGWYITDEPGLAAFDDYATYFDYYARVVRAIRAHSGKAIIVSPYLKGVGTRTPAEVGRRSREFLAATGVDILNWQDSVGTYATNIGWDGRAGSYTAGDYYRAIAAEIGSDRVWADIELFTTSARGNTGGGYQPTSMARLARQIALAGDAVGRRTTWINQRHMTAVAADAFRGADRLLAAYAAWCEDEGRLVTPVSYAWTTPPDPRYPDRGNELFDRASADPKSYLDRDWVGVSHDATVVVDLGRPRPVAYVACELLQQTAAGVRFPTALELSFSNDGTTWSDPVVTELGFEGLDGDYVLSNRAPLGAEGRYLTITLRNTFWTFVSEIEIVETPAAAPERTRTQRP